MRIVKKLKLKDKSFVRISDKFQTNIINKPIKKGCEAMILGQRFRKKSLVLSAKTNERYTCRCIAHSFYYFFWLGMGMVKSANEIREMDI